LAHGLERSQEGVRRSSHDRRDGILGEETLDDGRNGVPGYGRQVGRTQEKLVELGRQR
jgi:hypothetical protein